MVLPRPGFFRNLIYKVVQKTSKPMALFAPSILIAHEDLYEINCRLLNGKSFDLSVCKGKKILFVNVASECGYTPQYAGLQQLSEKFADKLVVIGVPSNQFGAQEPGTAEQIGQFCAVNYGVTFPILAKADVKGLQKHPLYNWLTNSTQNSWNEQEPTWNFCKYLVSEDGRLLAFFEAGVDPLDEQLVSLI